MRYLAIIPARGGSKRLPRKNVLPFHGKPMVLWTLEAAAACGMFTRVLVSTEDDVISGTVTDCGFEVLRRPERLATDAAGCTEVCLHVLEELEKQGHTFDALCCLYATAPLRCADDIAATLALLGDDTCNEADFSFAVTRYANSPFQMLVPAADGFLQPAWPLLAACKSQELPEPLIGNGSTYAARVDAFRRYKTFYGPRLRGHVMPRLRSIDIDTQEDYELALLAAESVFSQKKTTSR